MLRDKWGHEDCNILCSRSGERTGEELTGICAFFKRVQEPSEPCPTTARGVRKISDTFLEIHLLYINPKYFGTGIGSKLLVRAENEAKKRGLTGVFLTAAATAVGFYEKHNYVKGKTVDYGTGELIEMTKHFNDMKPIVLV